LREREHFRERCVPLFAQCYPRQERGGQIDPDRPTQGLRELRKVAARGVSGCIRKIGIAA
jgi:hypothetical protein